MLSIVSFLGYGTACLTSHALVVEFERYGLPRWRVLVGSLEVAGALGLVASYFLPVLGLAAAVGLSLMMFFGVLTRIRIRDPFLLQLPAIFLMVTNAWLTLELWSLSFAPAVGESEPILLTLLSA